MTAQQSTGSTARVTEPAGYMTGPAAFPARPRLPEPASDGAAIFERLGESLGRVRELHMHTATDLAAFVDLTLQGEKTGTEPLLELQARLQAMQAAIEGQNRSITPAEERRLILAAEKPLRLLSGNGRLLAAVCTMTRTISASFAIGELDAYVLSLDRIAKSITESSADVSENIDNWKLKDLGAQESCRAAGAILAPLCLMLERKADGLAMHASREREASRQAQQRAQKLTRQAQDLMKQLITAIQYSDRLAQRLDHLAALQKDTDPHVRHLAGEQACSIAGDTNDIARQVSITMRDLSEIGRRGAAFFARGVVAEQIERGLNERAMTVDQVDSEIVIVQQTLQSAGKDAQAARELIDEAARQFQTLEDCSKELANAAINASLIALRTGGTRGPLTTLSSEVRQIAAQCLDAESTSRAALQQLIQSNLQAQEDIVAAGVALEFSVEQYRERLTSSRDDLENLNAFRQQASRRASALLELMEDVGRDMEALKQSAEALNAHGNQMLETPLTGAPNRARLAAVWALYTMEEERAVHRRLFGSGEPELVAQTSKTGPAPSADDLDDILF
ncbi:hypothetical protein [Chachezhania sediminis]|uniref:hypothetical protein n=1 Tax=Chachezhania sediminis TaxID=2599291 RepID=UPI00131C6CEC|nr:hypothetical protein [Chachezhania sediminis]